ncbi:uncharacterized protein RHOBADRAFT_50622, partial [Rhodotorula graminis WP1]
AVDLRTRARPGPPLARVALLERRRRAAVRPAGLPAAPPALALGHVEPRARAARRPRLVARLVVVGRRPAPAAPGHAAAAPPGSAPARPAQGASAQARRRQVFQQPQGLRLCRRQRPGRARRSGSVLPLQRHRRQGWLQVARRGRGGRVRARAGPQGLPGGQPDGPRRPHRRRRPQGAHAEAARVPPARALRPPDRRALPRRPVPGPGGGRVRRLALHPARPLRPRVGRAPTLAVRLRPDSARRTASSRSPRRRRPAAPPAAAGRAAGQPVRRAAVSELRRAAVVARCGAERRQRPVRRPRARWWAGRVRRGAAAGQRRCRWSARAVARVVVRRAAPARRSAATAGAAAAPAAAGPRRVAAGSGLLATRQRLRQPARLAAARARVRPGLRRLCAVLAAVVQPRAAVRRAAAAPVPDGRRRVRLVRRIGLARAQPAAAAAAAAAGRAVVVGRCRVGLVRQRHDAVVGPVRHDGAGADRLAVGHAGRRWAVDACARQREPRQRRVEGDAGRCAVRRLERRLGVGCAALSARAELVSSSPSPSPSLSPFRLRPTSRSVQPTAVVVRRPAVPSTPPSHVVPRLASPRASSPLFIALHVCPSIASLLPLPFVPLYTLFLSLSLSRRARARSQTPSSRCTSPRSPCSLLPRAT